MPGFDHALQSPANAQRASFLLPLPQLQANGGANGDRWQTVTLKAGQTLSAVFDQLNIPQRELLRVAKQPTLQPMLRKLRPGAEIAFNLPADGSVRGMRIDNNGESAEYEFGSDAVRERAVPHETTTRTVVLTGTVGKSLFRSARALGLGSAQLNQLTDEMFQVRHRLRFGPGPERPLQRGRGPDLARRQLASTGPVLAATFTVDGKLKSAFRFVRDGKAEYFTPDGRSLKAALHPHADPVRAHHLRLRHAPPSDPRPHARAPGHRLRRRHRHPIMAAGDARVQFVGWKGYGRVVILDHGGGRTTLYGHMSRFGSERVGQRVSQGAVIGYVGGMSGLATGPHLHYEFRINGVHQNPLKMTMPPPAPADRHRTGGVQGRDPARAGQDPRGRERRVPGRRHPRRHGRRAVEKG